MALDSRRSRQLRHMASPAYKAPVQWDTTKKDKQLEDTPGSSSYRIRFEKARQQIHHSILQTGFGWLINVGLILGGYDKIWQLSRIVTERVTLSTNAMPGRLLTTTAFILFNVALGQLTSSVVTTCYRAIISADIPSTTTTAADTSRNLLKNVVYVKNPEKKEQVSKWPAWKHITIVYTAIAALVGVPLMVTTALYEWMGPNTVAPMTKSVLMIGGLYLAALNAPIIYVRWKGKMNNIVKDPRDGAAWPTLAEWAKENRPEFEPAKLIERVGDISPGDREVLIVVRPKEVEETEISQEGQDWLDGPTLSHLATGQLLVCYPESQVERFDLNELTAMFADASYPQSWKRLISLSQLPLSLVLGSFPLLHHWYCQRPALLLDVFPNLSPVDLQYIPLGVSWTMTILFHEASSSPRSILDFQEKKSIYERDALIAKLTPDCGKGWSRVLVRREQSATDQGVPDWDIGTTDPVYSFLRTGGMLSTTERVAALESLTETYTG